MVRRSRAIQLAIAAAFIHATICASLADELTPTGDITTEGLRLYYFDTPLNEIVNQLAVQTGRTVVGPIPTERVTVDCGRDRMNFELAIMRLCAASMRLRSAEFLWHDVQPGGVRTIQMRRFPCHGGLQSIFIDVPKFAQSRYDGADFAMLLQDCRYSPAVTAKKYEALMPSYVVCAPYPGKQCVTLFAAAGDIRLYSALLDMLDIALQDTDVLVEEIMLVNSEPDALADVLTQFYPGTIVYRRLGKERFTEPADAAPPLRVWTDWAHRRAVVTGSAPAVAGARQLAGLLDESAFLGCPILPTDIPTSGLQSLDAARR